MPPPRHHIYNKALAKKQAVIRGRYGRLSLFDRVHRETGRACSVQMRTPNLPQATAQSDMARSS